MQQSASGGEGGAPRRLVIMRHARAESVAPSDHERSLAPSGRVDAAAAGRWLLEQGVVPDAALVSDAQRTRDTWAELAAGAGWDCAPGFSSALYAAGADSVFDLLDETDPAIGTLVVVGHNPTMAYVAELLDDGEGDDDATTGMITRGFPTSALAVFEVDVPWAELGPGTGRLCAFHLVDG